jgi:(E)-4-hydroxy-3-methyl-but-2-enyl pyrophosphate reductase
LFQPDNQTRPWNRVVITAEGREAIRRLRADGSYLTSGGLTLRLADAYGFCQGVKHAVEKAIQTIAAHQAHLLEEPSSPTRLFMTGEIIHNPAINEYLAGGGVEILPPYGSGQRLSTIRPSDWVIIPAFGITLDEETALRESQCRIIDTTCGWVRRIWKTVEQFSADDLTTVIHGKYEHEETRAIASRASRGFVILRNRCEAELLARAIRDEEAPDRDATSEDWFLTDFAERISPGFNRENDLERIGLVNQTTMLSTETEAIASILTDAMKQRTSAVPPGERFRTLDTFCPATQRRQDAVRVLLANDAPATMIVVGGFRSSNTAHLAQLAREQVPTYHVEDAGCLVSAGQLRHQIPGERTSRLAKNWKPDPPCTIAVTAGASTPDSEIDQILFKLLKLFGSALSLLLIGVISMLLSAAGAADGVTDQPPQAPWLDPEFNAEWGEPIDPWRIIPALTEPDSTGYDALHVRLTVTPDIEAVGLDGEAIWTVVVTEPELTSLMFDFFDNMTVRQAQVNGSLTTCSRGNNRLRLALPSTPSIGDTLVARISYTGVPEHGYFWGYDVRYHDDVPIVYTSCEPIASRTWWPNKDRPDDKFTADLIFIVPDTLTAVSNGVLVEQTQLSGNRKRFHWHEAYPIVSYLVSLTATNFAYFEDTYTAIDGTEMPLTYWAYPEDLERAQSEWAITKEAISLFANLFGEYPFIDEKYGMAEYPWGGAMEHQTLSSMGDYFFDYEATHAWVVVHELAHQWWGDWVTCEDWRDIWLNEGFATYCEALWAESQGGADSLRTYMKTKQSDFWRGSVYDPNFVLNGAVYRKGAWVLHMLRHVMGDDAFFPALRTYGARHAYSTAVTGDLVEVCEEFHGESLEWFFQQWIYGEGQPRYRLRWEPETPPFGDDYFVRLDVIQESTGPHLFKMPIDLVFHLTDGSEVATVIWDSLAQQEFMIQLPCELDSISVDPGGWLLAQTYYITEPQGVPDDELLRNPAFTLGAPSPNPMQQGTTIAFIKGSDETQSILDEVELAIYDVSGRQIRRLDLDRDIRGNLNFHWDGNTDHGFRATPGIYFARPSKGTDTNRATSLRIMVIR